MADHPDDFIVVPISPLTEEQAEAFRAGAQAGLQKGAEHERAAIVAWLREAQGSVRWPDEDGIRITRWDGNEFADGIERGKHLRGDDE